MGLADRYKEIMKEQGQDFSFSRIKPKKDPAILFALIVGAAIAVGLYFLVAHGYSACTLNARLLASSAINASSSGITNPFSAKCGLNVLMYSFSAGLVSVLGALLTFKILKKKPNL